jgi:hypothetical protein
MHDSELVDLGQRRGHCCGEAGDFGAGQAGDFSEHPPVDLAGDEYRIARVTLDAAQFNDTGVAYQPKKLSFAGDPRRVSCLPV